MTLVLYHYVHCPFCLRVRMACGYLGKSYQSRVLSYDDEVTPVKLIGKKMLPIMEIDGKAINESLDIVAIIDDKNKLDIKTKTSLPEFKEFEKILNNVGNLVHSLAMPYWIYTPEFNEQSRTYFQQKKEEKRGPFSGLYKQRRKFAQELIPLLDNISKDLRPYYRSEGFSMYDIMLASHLWGLYVVPEFQFSSAMNEYLQNVGSICSFDYHQDFWS